MTIDNSKGISISNRGTRYIIKPKVFRFSFFFITSLEVFFLSLSAFRASLGDGFDIRFLVVEFVGIIASKEVEMPYSSYRDEIYGMEFLWGRTMFTKNYELRVVVQVPGTKEVHCMSFCNEQISVH